MDIDHPEKYVCPITLNLMIDPVKASDNIIYEKTAILDWLAINKTSPLTTKIITNKLIEVIELKKEIHKYINSKNIKVEKYVPVNNLIDYEKKKYELAKFVDALPNIINFNCFICNEFLIMSKNNGFVNCNCSIKYSSKSCLNCEKLFVVKEIESFTSPNFKCNECSHKICEQCIIC